MWGVCYHGGRVYLPPFAAANGSPPSAEGGEGWRRSHHKMVFRLCGGEAGAFRSPPPPLRGSHLLTGIAPKRWQVAAALSAAVTTTPKQGTASNSHRRTSREEKTSLFPAALRERGSGGEALLLEKRPLPQRLPPRLSSEGGPGEGLLFREAASPGVPRRCLSERRSLCAGV